MNWRATGVLLLTATLLPVTLAIAQEEEPTVEKEKPTVEGGTRNCIGMRRVRRTKIVDDNNVLFYLSGRLVLHNRLRGGCPGLKSLGKFSFTSSDGTICQGDGIAAGFDDSFGPVRPMPTCWLGVHQEVTREDADEMMEAAMMPQQLTPSPRPLPMPEPAEVGIADEEEPE